MNETGTKPVLLALVEDLFFTSRIESTAGQLGLKVRSSEPVDAAAQKPYLVVVDLNAARIGGVAAIQRLQADPALADIPIIAFGSHVDADLLRAAREAGAEQALAKSRFVTSMADLFQSYLKR